jgi:outer membrane receptor for monomeric catechols
VRFDRFDLTYHNNRNNDTLSRMDNLVSPRAGIVIKPVTDLSLYTSYSVSYLPSSGDQFSSLTTITQQVKPEKFNNYEVGVKWDARPDLSMSRVRLSIGSHKYAFDGSQRSYANHPNRQPTHERLRVGRDRSRHFEMAGCGRLLLSKWIRHERNNGGSGRCTSRTSAASHLFSLE